MTTPTTDAGLTCTCLPLNRRLMAHLLKVDEGSVHEQGCVERAAQESVTRVLDALQEGFMNVQRYSLTIEPDDSAYMELDPDARWVIDDDVEAFIEQHRPKETL